MPFETELLGGTPYRAVRRLGQGGMGEVFEAVHIALEKRVVVKLIRSELSGDGALVERLRLEARAMARLNHPNIATVHDLGVTAAGRAYLVLEYLEGCTLSRELHSRGHLPVREALGIALDVLDALGAAHAAGLVHRDVKPPNVFLCDPDAKGRRVVKLLDFGIVKETAPRTERTFPTEEGRFVGSPAVAAPEQARSEAVDARTDIYAAGLLLYTMVTGRNPFAQESVSYSRLWAHLLLVPAAASAVAPQPIPPALDVILEKALAKRPSDRYAGTAHMIAALERVVAVLPADPAPPIGAVRGAASGDRARFGTVVMDDPKAGAATSSEGATLEPITLRRDRTARFRMVLHRVLIAWRRVPAPAVIAIASGGLFFVLFRLVWSMLRGTR